MMENNSKVILEVKGLKKYFPLQKDMFGKPKAFLRAVDDVTFKLDAGKTIGVVGESGCGKTTLGRTILQLYDTTGGKTLYYGHTIEEVLPKYYIGGIKKLPSYAAKYNSLKNKLNALLTSLEYDIHVNTLNDLSKALDKVNSDVKELDKTLDKEKINSFNKLIDLLTNIINVLEESATTTGGFILGDYNKAKDLILRKLNIGNSFYKNNEADLGDSLNSINEELIKISNEIENKALFKELELIKETGLDLAKLTKEEMRSLRTEIQLIFQDPYSSLPPRMTIGSILTEPVKVHGIVEKEKVNEHVHKIMKMCGLQPQYYDRYPHEFSGGQRQRICIARALAVNPKLVICDEPVSALDVSIQAQIINLLKELQNNLGLTYMFISHDLSVVKYITDSIIVMYLGNMMEIGDTKDIFQNPLHPYTKALFSAVPVPDPDAKMNRIILKGDIPSPANPPKGCKFHTRCEKCMSVCKLKNPKFIQYDENHVVACHLYDNEVMANLEKYDFELAELERLEQEKALEANENNKKSLLNKILKK